MFHKLNGNIRPYRIDNRDFFVKKKYLSKIGLFVELNCKSSLTVLSLTFEENKIGKFPRWFLKISSIIKKTWTDAL